MAVADCFRIGSYVAVWIIQAYKSILVSSNCLSLCILAHFRFQKRDNHQVYVKAFPRYTDMDNYTC